MKAQSARLLTEVFFCGPKRNNFYRVSYAIEAKTTMPYRLLAVTTSAHLHDFNTRKLTHSRFATRRIMVARVHEQFNHPNH